MTCEGAVHVLRLDVVHIVAWQPAGAAFMLVLVGYDWALTLESSRISRARGSLDAGPR
jgi:hypothetical protein